MLQVFKVAFSGEQMIYTFKVSGDEQEIVSFERELLAILKRIMNWGDMSAHEIHFCIHESILNILQHSYKWDTEIPIEIKLNFSGDIENHDLELEIQIRDFGPSIEKKIEAPSEIERFQMRRRGLYMISKIMDEFYIKPKKKGGNVTYMKKNLSLMHESA